MVKAEKKSKDKKVAGKTDEKKKEVQGFTNEIYAYSLKNAIEFGKADVGKIMPKLFQHGLLKEKIKEVMPEIQTIVKEVNSMKAEAVQAKFLEYSKFVKEKVEEERKLPELANAHIGKVVVRLAPYPSGALHIGNAKTYMLNALYAEKYKGKILLVMDDTIGSEEKKIAKEAYKLIPEGFDWLGFKYDKKIVYKSDRLKLYYEYAEKLIEKNAAYVCHCPQLEMRQNRAKGIECGCREFPKELQLKRWKEMFNMEDGDAVLRLKTNMMHPNPAFRDRVLFKISHREHPRVGNKYSVWPTLEMSWAIDDHELGITHIIRGNDLMIESDVERFIWELFKWKQPEINHVGLVRLEGVGAKLSKSKAQKEVNEGTFTGWDDPRTWSLQSLKRRGFLPEAIRTFVEEIGLNRTDIVVPIDSLYAINRKMIDALVNRYSFVANPKELIVTNRDDERVVEIPVHPERKESRKVEVERIFISNEDFEKFKGTEVRLIHLFNVLWNANGNAKMTSKENKSIQKIQWVSHTLPTRIIMPDGKVVEGFAESAVGKVKEGEVIQFERVGFVCYQGVKDKKHEFWFSHN